MTPADGHGILLQEPRDFTVQILRDRAVMGAGLLVSTDGLILTCRHVLAQVRAAAQEDDSPRDARIRVRFPERITGTATVHEVVSAVADQSHDDDLVCLRVSDPPALTGRNVAKLGDATDSVLHEFRSYGYRRIDKYLASYSDGLILGTVDPPQGHRLRCDPVQLRSQNIDHGMSGAGVLDRQKNLVVGLISETWYGNPGARDRDTGWAVNAKVISFSGLGIPLHTSLPLSSARRPARRVRPGRPEPYPAVYLDRAPEPLDEWVGRGDIIGQLREHWADEDGPLVVGLIGFGGEGKTSLVRRFVDTLLDEDQEPDGVFWWQFSQSAGPDEFLSALLEYLLKDRRVVAGIARPARAEVAASQLDTGRHLIVLDGLEAVQRQDGDQYGAITDPDLLAFLRFAAVPGHESLCVVTSRAPVVDLLSYITYRHVDLEALSVADGRDLCRRLGVLGSDAAIDQLVGDWGCHALSLSLLAAYLVRRHGGDARRPAVFPRLDPAKSRDEMAAQILREYDDCLDPAERALLSAFAVYRTPIAPAALGTEGAEGLLEHLIAARIIRRDGSGRLAMHPLVRDHYLRRIAVGRTDLSRLHEAAKLHYLAIMEPAPARPSLRDLEPAIEAAHHAARSGDFDGAGDIIYEHLYQGERGVITRELNAYSTVLSVFQDFFPDQQLHRAPLVENAETRAWVFHETATALQMLGRLDESAHLLRRAVEEFKQRESWHEAAVSCQNLAESQLDAGALAAAEAAIAEAFVLAERAADPEDELVAQTLKGGLAHLRGQPDVAEEAFEAALALARDFTPLPILYSTSGLHYADHLRRTDRATQARKVHELNLNVCQEAGWQADEAKCRVGLGDLALADGRADDALAEYERAISIARRITRRDALIHALVGRARHAVETGAAETGVVEAGAVDFTAGTSELEQAVAMARAGGYRILEIDAMALSAKARIHADAEEAWEIAARADQASINLGYHWGHVEAEAVLRELRGPAG